MPLPATPFYYGPLLAWDPVTRAAVASAGVQFFAEGDTAFATPLEVWDHTGTSLGTTLTSTSTGHVAPYVLAVATAVARSGTWSTPVYAFKELLTAAEAAQAAAEAAAASAASALPTGGETGYVLTKQSPADADVGWAASSGGTGGGGAPALHSHPVTDLRKTDGSTALAAVVLDVLLAGDATTIRQKIGAGTGNGTSNLALGTTSTTAAAGDHTHSIYTTETRVEEMIDASTLASNPSNTVSVVRQSGAYPTQPASYPAGTVRVAYGSVPPTYGSTPGVILDKYVPTDGI